MVGNVDGCKVVVAILMLSENDSGCPPLVRSFRTLLANNVLPAVLANGGRKAEEEPVAASANRTKHEIRDFMVEMVALVECCNG